MEFLNTIIVVMLVLYNYIYTLYEHNASNNLLFECSVRVFTMQICMLAVQCNLNVLLESIEHSTLFNVT